MANKYCNLDGYRKIKDTFGEINTGFDGVEDDLGALDDRVDTIITTPIDGGAAAQELVDARKGEATLGAKIDAMDNALGSHLADDVTDVGGAHGLIVERGTWAPGLFRHITEADLEKTINSATYLRMGDLVFLSASIVITKINSQATGNIRIRNLPFKPKGTCENVSSFIKLTGLEGISEAIIAHENDNCLYFVNPQKNDTLKVNYQIGLIEFGIMYYIGT